MAWIRFIPGFLLRTFVRLASRTIGMQMRYGVVGISAAGMFGAGAMRLVPLSAATVRTTLSDRPFSSYHPRMQPVRGRG